MRTAIECTKKLIDDHRVSRVSNEVAEKFITYLRN